MKIRLGFLAVSFLILSTLFPTSALAETRGLSITSKQGRSLYLYKDYHALVIGVSDYEQWPDLPNAVKDAREVANKLEQLGFDVKLVLNPSSKEMKNAFTDVVYGIGSEENRAILIYFAGHGETLDLADGTKLGYIIPSDCPLKMKDPIGFDEKAISMKEMEILALKVKSKHLLMVFDSCFSGSIFNMVRAAPVNISEKSALPVRQFITAGGAGEQVPDQSIFKVVFLKGIAGDADLNGDGYVTGSELGMQLQEKVVNYSRGGQHPQYGKINNPKLDMGDFIFAPPETGGKEVAEKIALEEELNRLRAEMEKTSRAVRELQTKEQQEKQLAYAPKTTKGLLGQLKNGQGPFVIDDFEDGNLRSETLDDKWIRRTKGPSRINVSPDRTQGANGTSSSMKIDYELGVKAVCRVQMGRSWDVQIQKIEQGVPAAYDLSRFHKISFFLKGEKSKTLFSNPNRIHVTLTSYGKGIKSQFGKYAQYYNKDDIAPDTEWRRIEIPLQEFIPSEWTKHNVFNYPDSPDFNHILSILFMFTSYKSEGGIPGSNTVWIDEITLE